MSKWIFLSLLSFMPAFSVAGPHVVGNGGVSIVCRDPSTGHITDAELLDIFEAVSSGAAIPRSEAPVEAQLKNAFLRLQGTPGVAYEVQRTVKQITDKAQFLTDPSVGLPLSDDAIPQLRKKGCTYEQVALFDDATGVLKIDAEIYNAFSKTDAAALWLHEAIYKMDRMLNDATDSRIARGLTASLFATPVDKNLVANFNQRFSRYVIAPGDKVLWLDPAADLQMNVEVSDIPANSKCELINPFGDDNSFHVEADKTSYKSVLNIAVLGTTIGWLNGAKLGLIVTCSSAKGQSLVKATLTQKGQAILTVKATDFSASTVWRPDCMSQKTTVNGESLDGWKIRIL